MFVDSDDLLAEDALERLYNELLPQMQMWYWVESFDLMQKAGNRVHTRILRITKK